MADNVRIALVGVGAIGSKYAAMIVSGQVKNMVLTGLVARKPEAKAWARALVSGDGTCPKVYGSVDEMFAHAEDFDAVLIATPHKTHEEMAVRAFELGKHVLCDKPAGVTIGQAQRMLSESKKYNRMYALAFQQRAQAKYRYIKQLLDNGELGVLKRALVVNSQYFRTAHYHRSGSWRSSWNGEGGGALINQGAHILDMWQWLLGMPRKIYAQIPFGKYNDFNVDDEATISMQYADGMTGTFILTTGEAAGQERFEILGTKGRILLENNTLHVYRYSRDLQEYMTTEKVNSGENMGISEEVINFEKVKERHEEVLENFAKAVLAGDASILIAPGEAGVNQLMLTNGAYYSAWKDMPVTLPLDAEEYEKAFWEMCEAEQS
jgi:predicted dehydrogenase